MCIDCLHMPLNIASARCSDNCTLARPARLARRLRDGAPRNRRVLAADFTAQPVAQLAGFRTRPLTGRADLGMRQRSANAKDADQLQTHCPSQRPNDIAGLYVG